MSLWYASWRISWITRLDKPLTLMASISSSSMARFLYLFGVCHHSRLTDWAELAEALWPLAAAEGAPADWEEGLGTLEDAAPASLEAGRPPLRKLIMGMWGLMTCKRREKQFSSYDGRELWDTSKHLKLNCVLTHATYECFCHLIGKENDQE